MSLPAEIRDELLSGYLDDRLSGDERRRVEQLLETDAEAREVLSQLRTFRSTLQSMSNQSPKLPADFSQRVWQATVEAAQHESLERTHPVRLAVERQRKSAAFPARVKRIAGVLGALAATVLIGLAVLRPASNPLDDDIALSGDNALPGVEEVTAGEPENLPENLLVENDPVTNDASTPESSTSSEANDSSATDRVTPPAEGSQPDPAMVAESESAGEFDYLKDLLNGSPATSETGETAVASNAATPPTLNVTLMYEVALTRRGVEEGVIEQALEEVGITLGEDAVLDEETLQQLAAAKLAPADDSADGSVNVYYIESTGQRVDRLFLVLAAAVDQVERVGLRLVADPPVARAVQQIGEFDPTQIRHAEGADLAMALAFEAADRIGNEFATTGDLGFRPMSRISKEQLERAREETPTIISQVLLLVKQPQ